MAEGEGKHTEEDQAAVAVAVGARIKRARQRAGIKQFELARALGSAVSWVNELERGDGNATLRSLARIAAAIGVSVKELMPGEDQAAVQQSNAELAQLLAQALALQAAPVLREFLDGVALLIRDLQATLDRAAPRNEDAPEQRASAEPTAPASYPTVPQQARRRTRRPRVQ